jgi:FkbM family methyltransferase
MARRAFIRALKSIRYAPQLMNWADVSRAVWRREPVRRLCLRNGWVIDGAPQTGLMKLYREIWWRDEYRLRAQPLPAGATVIDIGANVGMFAFCVASLSRPRRILCYEPFPDSFGLLRRNIERNAGVPITAFPVAVAGRSGTRALYVDASAACNGFFAGAGLPAVSVDCVTLAQVFEGEGVARCDLLKLDCEGAEFEILLNTPPAVLSCIDRVALEYHEQLTGRSSDELIDRLRAAGFTVRRDASGRRSGYVFAVRAE